MNSFVRSYLAYTRGEKSLSPWLVLKPAGWLSSVVIRLRRALYDHGIYSSEETPLAVISVGNLTTGGTNKTPFVEYLVRKLRDYGLKPGIVSRGYGGQASEPVVVLAGQGERTVVGDEPLLLSKHLPDVPVAVSSDRLADVRALQKIDRDVVVADDAFQHRKLGRSLDIVLIDALCPFGNGATLPAGILREVPSALNRAHIVVITKSDQAPQHVLEDVKREICKWVPETHVFLSHLSAPEWFVWSRRDMRKAVPLQNGTKVAAFSGIGNPKSFLTTIATSEAVVTQHYEFKDHHHYTRAELAEIESAARAGGAEALCCTEKDVFNLPEDYEPALPLYVPRIGSELVDEQRFWNVVTETLRPRLVVASNGYGEDAIGSALALKLQERFKAAHVCAFPLVGRGEQYSKNGVDIRSPLIDTPTGGIIKYHLKDLWTEIKAGLFGHIGHQLRMWKKLRNACCSVLCVGDAYLLCHTLWGQGKKAVMIATAKTKYISGHWRLESFLYKKCSTKVWTRDEATALELRDYGVNAVFEGNPIMDLQLPASQSLDYWEKGRRILVLPGSRKRAYQDLELVLGTLERAAVRTQISAVMVLAPSIETQKVVDCAKNWIFDGQALTRPNIKVRLFKGEVSQVARGAELLLGLAGTANQVCAGMGIPVLSIREKGKFVQKKLLGDAEILVEPTAKALAGETLRLLESPDELRAMSEAGKKRLGSAGALNSVVDYADVELGWSGKCRLYEKLTAKTLAEGV